VDYGLWDPATDGYIAKKYAPEDRDGKRANKECLQKSLGLAVNPKVPLFGVLSRLTEQKGVDILIDAVPFLMINNVQLAVMGEDQGGYLPRLKALEGGYPGQFRVVDFDEEKSHQVIAGSDVLINPARFEPCGLTQMFAMKYGTVPFARMTGGLRDTIVDANFQNTIVSPAATGFLFENYSLHDFAYGVNRILGTYRNERRLWGDIMRRGMAQNFSWDKSAAQYMDIYNTQLELR
jgi:starch synthase